MKHATGLHVKNTYMNFFFYNFANTGYFACFGCPVKESKVGRCIMKHGDLSFKNLTFDS